MRNAPPTPADEIDSQKSVTSGPPLPLNPSGPTPTMVISSPPMRTARPTTPGSVPNCVRHVRWFTTA